MESSTNASSNDPVCAEGDARRGSPDVATAHQAENAGADPRDVRTNIGATDGAVPASYGANGGPDEALPGADEES